MSLKDKLGGDKKADPLGLIPGERLQELRDEARVKARAKLQKEAEDKFLSAEIERQTRELDPKPEHERRMILVDAADHTSVVRVDNQYFFYGQQYEVTKPVYDQLQDILARGWAHEKEISAPSRRVFSNNRGAVLHGAGNEGGARF